jgi:hypothetical protein
LAGQVSDTRTLNQIWVHCRSAIEKGIQDEWTVGTEFLAFVNNEKYAKQKVKRLIPGGADLRFNIEYEAGNATSFYGFDPIPLEAPDPWGQGKQDWRAIAVPTGVAMTEILETNGERNAVGRLVANKAQHALNTFRSELSAQLVKGNDTLAGTLGDGKDVDGLKFALQYQNDQNDGYAGFDRSTDTWWRHEIQNVGTSFTVGSGVVTADNITKWLDYYMRLCQRGKGSMGYITALLCSFNLGYSIPTYNNVPLLYEPAIDSNLAGASGEAGQTIYGLNTRYMRLFVNKAADMKMSDMKEIAGQKAYRADLIWVGNLSIVNPRFFFTLFGIDAPSIS